LKRPNKILISIPCLSIGGTEIQTLNQARVLTSIGYYVEVLCYFEHELSTVDEFEHNGIHVRLLNLERKLHFIKFIKRIVREIRTSKPQIVHVQYMSPGALPIIAARLAGSKTILATVHQPYTKSHGIHAKIILRVIALFTTKFIAVSQNAEKSWFGDSGLFNENKPVKLQSNHFTIHNAIDIEKIQEIVSSVNTVYLRKDLLIPDGIPVIGAVSRLRHEKGIDLLIEAFNQLIINGANAHLLLVGNGPDEQKLKDTVQTYEINSSVTFYGEAGWERTMQLLSIMDIVVVPSRFEGFGLTAAEGMAMGKPVIASATSGLKEVVVHEETGILFPVDDVQTLKTALERLVNDPDLRERLGSTGKERVRANFSIDLFCRKIKALYS